MNSSSRGKVGWWRRYLCAAVRGARKPQGRAALIKQTQCTTQFCIQVGCPSPRRRFPRTIDSYYLESAGHRSCLAVVSIYPLAPCVSSRLVSSRLLSLSLLSSLVVFSSPFFSLDPPRSFLSPTNRVSHEPRKILANGNYTYLFETTSAYSLLNYH